MGWLEGALGFCSAGDKVAMRLQYPKDKEGSGRRMGVLGEQPHPNPVYDGY